MLLFYNKMLDVTLVFKTWSHAFAATEIVRKVVGLEARYSRISVEKVKIHRIPMVLQTDATSLIIATIISKFINV